MRHISCDFCSKELTPGTEACFTVTLEARQIFGPVEWVASATTEREPEGDHIEIMDEMLTSLPDDETIEEPLDPLVPLNRSFDLCGRCYQRFTEDPFGRSLRRSLSFSAN